MCSLVFIVMRLGEKKPCEFVSKTNFRQLLQKTELSLYPFQKMVAHNYHLKSDKVQKAKIQKMYSIVQLINKSSIIFLD